MQPAINFLNRSVAKIRRDECRGCTHPFARLLHGVVRRRYCLVVMVAPMMVMVAPVMVVVTRNEMRHHVVVMVVPSHMPMAMMVMTVLYLHQSTLAGERSRV